MRHEMEGYSVELSGRGIPKEPEHADEPTLKALYGEPPWALTSPDFGGIPEESTDCVGALVWRNRVYVATGRVIDVEARKGAS